MTWLRSTAITLGSAGAVSSVILVVIIRSSVSALVEIAIRAAGLAPASPPSAITKCRCRSASRPVCRAEAAATSPRRSAKSAPVKAMEADRPRVAAAVSDAQSAQTGLIRYNEMANLIPTMLTGLTAGLRGAAAARLEELGISHETIQMPADIDSIPKLDLRAQAILVHRNRRPATRIVTDRPCHSRSRSMRR
jgi:hypothetical protein